MNLMAPLGHCSAQRPQDTRSGVDTNDGIYGNCQFTVQSCKQCADPQCAKYCPVHAVTIIFAGVVRSSMRPEAMDWVVTPHDASTPPTTRPATPQQSCKQCADPQCAKYCPVHAISADEETGARVVDPKL